MPKILIDCNLDTLGALHCDNPRCGYDLPLGEQRWGPHLIGMPCPKCDSNMLTRRDFEGGEQLLRVAAFLNKWFGWLGKDPKKNPEAFRRVALHHHNGKTTTKVL